MVCQPHLDAYYRLGVVYTMQNFTVKQDQEEAEYYTKSGLEEFKDDEGNSRLYSDGDNVFAKAVKNKLTKSFTGSSYKNYSFYIKTDPDKKVYDPSELYSIESRINKSFINKVCKNILVYTKVTQSIFNKYLLFLRTGSRKILQEIQREIK